MTRTTPFDSTQQSKGPKSLPQRDTGSMHLQERIRQRAYELYETQGRRDGHHQEDWAQAEEEILSQYGLKNVA